MKDTIELPVEDAQRLVSVLGNALDQAFGGGGLTMLTVLQARINVARTPDPQPEPEADA